MEKKKQPDGVGVGALIKRKKEKNGGGEGGMLEALAARLALGTGLWGLQL